MSPAPAYLLDTNVLSETRRKKADEGVMALLQSADSASLFLSVLTIGELRKGVTAKMCTDMATARSLAAWVEGLEFGFSDRILGIEREAADAWGRLMAQAERNGTTPAVLDVWIPAIAEVHGMTLVTRNVADFASPPRHVFNP